MKGAIRSRVQILKTYMQEVGHINLSTVKLLLTIAFLNDTEDTKTPIKGFFKSLCRTVEWH